MEVARPYSSWEKESMKCKLIYVSLSVWGLVGMVLRATDDDGQHQDHVTHRRHHLERRMVPLRRRRRRRQVLVGEGKGGEKVDWKTSNLVLE